jgi:hypothetical protein
MLPTKYNKFEMVKLILNKKISVENDNLHIISKWKLSREDFNDLLYKSIYLKKTKIFKYLLSKGNDFNGLANTINAILPKDLLNNLIFNF